MKLGILSILVLVAASPMAVFSADVPFEFDTVEKEQRYLSLIEELRCLVCQNQSLADSHAPLAQDLRDEVYRMVNEEDDKDTIIAFLVDRYGDFVLYKPPVKGTTWLLWFGPFLLLTLACIVVVVLTRGKKPAPAPLTDEERERLQALLDEERRTE